MFSQQVLPVSKVQVHVYNITVTDVISAAIQSPMHVLQSIRLTNKRSKNK